MVFIENFNEFSRDDIWTEISPYLVHPSIVVILPKSGPIHLSATENLVNDYQAAAYAGQLLGTYAPGTTHDPALLNDDGDFEFTVPLNDFEELVNILETLSHGFGSGDEDEQLGFWDDAEQLADDVKAGKITAFCPDLIDTYWELVNSLEENDADG